MPKPIINRCLSVFIAITACLAAGVFPPMALADGRANETNESIPFFEREISLQGRPVRFILSRDNALETRIEDLDFYLRNGCRLYLEGVHFQDNKNKIDENSLGLRTSMMEADGTYGRLWSYRLSLGGLTRNDNPHIFQKQFQWKFFSETDAG